MNDANWKATLQQSIGDPTTRFTVMLDGVRGASPYNQFMSAAQSGFSPLATPFNWEMGQLYQAGLRPKISFMQDLQPVSNPFK
jgi:hypothetical protein